MSFRKAELKQLCCSGFEVCTTWRSCAALDAMRHLLSSSRRSCNFTGCICCLAPLLLFLHTEVHLTGTKLGCAEGGCGACTVMVSHQAETKLVHRSVNACLCPLYAVEGMHIVTAEGEQSL